VGSYILVVDDDEVLGRVLCRVLSRAGHEAELADSVGQALRLARAQAPRVVLLDLCLPDGDGLELARQLRLLAPDAQLVLITAFPLRLRDHPELATNFVRVLTKPLDVAELRQVVDTCLATCS
jgi:CheY-like chemotaxis protein